MLSTLASAAVGEGVFLLLISRQPGGGDGSAELAVGCAVAGALALVAAFVFLRSALKSLLPAVAAAALVYPLWFVYAVGSCVIGGCDLS